MCACPHDTQHLLEHLCIVAPLNMCTPYMAPPVCTCHLFSGRTSWLGYVHVLVHVGMLTQLIMFWIPFHICLQIYDPVVAQHLLEDFIVPSRVITVLDELWSYKLFLMINLVFCLCSAPAWLLESTLRRNQPDRGLRRQSLSLPNQQETNNPVVKIIVQKLTSYRK